MSEEEAKPHSLVVEAQLNPTRSPKRLWILLLTLAIIVVVVAAFVWSFNRETNPPVAQQSSPPASATPQIPPHIIYASTQEAPSSTRMANLATSNIEGGEVKDLRVSGLYNAFMDAVTSPLGHVAFVSWVGAGMGVVDTLEFVKPDGTKSKILTFTPGKSVNELALTADGKRLAYTIHDHQANSLEMWAVNTDGTNNTRILKDLTPPDLDSPFHFAPAQWTDDQKYLLLRPGSLGTDAPRPLAFYRLNLASGQVEKVANTGTNGWRPANYAYSPDGTKLAYGEAKYDTSPEYAPYGRVIVSALRVIDLKTSKTTTIIENATSIGVGSIAWSANSKSIVASYDGKLYSGPFTGGELRDATVTIAEGYQINQIGWAGDRLIYTLMKTTSGQTPEIRSIKTDGSDNNLVASASSLLFIGIAPNK